MTVTRSEQSRTVALARALADDAVDGQIARSRWNVRTSADLSAALLAMKDVEVLDLSDNFLKSIPTEIGQLKKLRFLDLEANPLESVPNISGLSLDWEVFKRLEGQISADHVVGIKFQGPLHKLPSQLLKLRNLRLLRFFSPQPDLPRGIGELQSLEELNIELTGLSTFPREILRLRGLKKLRLSSSISIVPDDLAQLIELRELELHHNRFDSMPTAIRHLPQLRYLNLSGNRLTGLPAWLSELKTLEVLWLTRNEIRSVPETIADLRQLTALVMIRNQLEDLPQSFARLDRLRALCLGENPFRQIPEAVFSLPALEALDLGFYTGTPGLLKVIPDRILDMPRLHILEVDGQPIETPPPEVVETGLAGIRAYYRQLGKEGKDYLCEAKLLIVGEPGAGKTSLAKKIEDPAYELKDDEESTEGIGVIHYEFPTLLRVEDDAALLARDFHVSIWDFGGQEIYHATHQFFLTKRSLYVLVADSRKEDTDFQYWMNIVELLSDGSPLIIVKNEKQDRRRDINESRLRGRFPNLRSIHATNLATSRGLEEVVRAIRAELERLPHIGSPLPRTWRRVREALEQDGRDHISVEEYKDICRGQGFAREEDMLQLSSYLHDLGVCLHFLDDPLLRKTVMLKPKWATDAVYRVLDNKGVMDRHGRFSRKDLAAIWSVPRYASMRDELVQLMMKFQLCYPLSSAEGTFLAPQLLESSPPNYPWDPNANLVVRYEYEFMPKGILTRFIVATHFLIPQEDWLWRDGVILKRQETLAEITEDYPQRRITVRLAGPDRRELLEVIDHELDKIHRGYPLLKMNRLIPCRCSVCAESQDPHFFPYETLRKFARDDKPIQCPESYDMVNVDELIDAVFPRYTSRMAPGLELSTRKEVFVSYAWGGESEEVVNLLEQTFRDRGVSIVRDKSEMRYKDSIHDFMRRIGRGKCIVVVLSRKYLESKNCMFELTQIVDRGDLRGRVFPVVLEDTEISNAVKRVGYVKFWEDKQKELNAALKEVNQENLDGIREELDLYAQIRGTISGLMKILGDMNALTIESHRDSRFATLISAVDAQLQS